MLTKLFAALMTVMLCLGTVPTMTTQNTQAEPAKHKTAIEARIEATQPAETVLLTAEQAQDIALSREGLTREAVTHLRAKLDRDDGTLEWNVEFRSGYWEYDCTVHAETGEILDWDKEYEPKKSKPVITPPPVEEKPAGQLTREEAQAIALQHACLTQEQITRLKVKLDRDDGVLRYEVEFRVGNWEYEYEIHAETGAILDWEKDYDD